MENWSFHLVPSSDRPYVRAEHVTGLRFGGPQPDSEHFSGPGRVTCYGPNMRRFERKLIIDILPSAVFFEPQPDFFLVTDADFALMRLAAK